MSFDWNKFRELAEELRRRDDEAAQRTSISRVYYAVYWKARLLLESEGFVFRHSDSSRKQIWDEYKNRGRTHRGVGFSGEKLRNNRTQADYSSEIKNIETLIKESFELADKILFYLKQIQPSNEETK
jgi:uncharacterized protein (UPF0332 family)